MATEELDAVVLGAGLAGLHQLHLLRSGGLRVLAYDAADDVGGAWWWHDFPGARLDVPSHLYQYFLSEQLYRDWGWSERFPGGYEVLRWLRFVADRLDLRRDVRLGTRIVAARFDEARGRWRLEGEAGETVDARIVVAATGTLPTPDVLADSETFAGPVLATSRWPRRAPDLRGRRIGVVALGTSAVQLVPTLADRVGSLTVFVHRAHDVVPRHNPMYGWQERERDALRFAELRDTLPHTPDGDEPGTRAEHVDPADLADPTALRDAMRARLGDPRLAEILVPAGEPGRVLPDDGWLEVFGRADVTLVDARSNPVVRACRNGVVLADGTVHELDAIVVAGEVDTGVDALERIDVRGRGGRPWVPDRIGALGVAAHGHPNLFVLASPRPPSAAAVNLAVARQEQSAWVARAIADLVAGGGTTIEAREPRDVARGTPADLAVLRRERLAESAAGYPSFSRV